MGSYIETNDTLQLTKEQGFPVELDYEKHKENPLTAESFSEKIFEFKDKPSIRIYHAPPVRNFLVENKDGKWLYWGKIHILEITHDYENKTTSGKYKIIEIFSPERMEQAFKVVDTRPEMDYLSDL